MLKINFISVILSVLKFDFFNSFYDGHPINKPFVLVTLSFLKLDKTIFSRDEQLTKMYSKIFKL